MTRNIDKLGEGTEEDVEAVREGYVEWLGHQVGLVLSAAALRVYIAARGVVGRGDTGCYRNAD